MSKSHPNITRHPFPVGLNNCPLGAEIFKKINKVSRYIEKIYAAQLYRNFIYLTVFRIAHVSKQKQPRFNL